ncbi:hypothetical protein BG842_12645 [Haladaptatus sp. W1]|uniref:metalloprotease family protein n=1 Tax=Haladaptatus sp. W1 TaxID=1897478 RepID=UPI000849E6D6|nr:metalloprotease family protein [Haladaptatus sp. W1]ODR83122.1 hypothetical protein BG842_12645 [Haladaptatus sp. W1]
MLFIPGFLISLVTFPGVMIHEYAHKKSCDRRNVSVLDVCYFRLGNPAGYVRHEKPKRYSDAFVISFAPFAVNTVVALLAFLSAFGVLWAGKTVQVLKLVGYVVLWIGFSAGMHAIPSNADATNVWRHAKEEWRTSVFALLGFPIVVLLYVANLLKFFWIDAIYALALLVLTIFAIGATMP